jgi:WD40 repeat protein
MDWSRGMLVFLALFGSHTLARAGSYAHLPPAAIIRIGTTTLRHENAVTALAFSPDGKVLASGGRDFSVRLWDADTGIARGELRHDDVIRSLAFLNPNTLISGERDGNILFWDLEKKVVRRRFPRVSHLGSFALSPDRKILASARGSGSAWEGFVVLWDTVSGKALDSARMDGDELVFSRDGKFVVTYTHNFGAVGWEIGASNKHQPLPVEHPVGLAAAGDGIIAAIGAETQDILLISAGAGKVVGKLPRPIGGNRLRFSPDGKTVAILGDKGGFWLLDTISRKTRRIPIPSRETTLTCVAFSPAGKRLAVGGDDGIVRLFDTANAVLSPVSEYQVKAACLSPDGKLLATRGADQILRLWDADTGKQKDKFDGLNDAARLKFSPDGKLLASSCNFDGKGGCRLWDVVKRKLVRAFPALFVQVFSPDGKLLASETPDQVLTVQEVQTGKILQRFRSIPNPNVTPSAFYHMVFSPDSRRLTAFSTDQKVRVWDLATGKLLYSFQAVRSWAGTPSFAPDGSWVALSGQSEGIRRWDLASGKELSLYKISNLNGLLSPDGKFLFDSDWGRTLTFWDVGKKEKISEEAVSLVYYGSVSFSRDWKRLASMNSDGSALVWDVARLMARKLQGKQVVKEPPRQKPPDLPKGAVLRLDKGYIHLIFSPSGKLLASAGLDRRIRLWDAVSGKMLREIEQVKEEPIDLAFSPDGKTLAISQKKRIRLWNPADGKKRGELTGANFLALVFSGNGKNLITAEEEDSGGGKVRVWDLEKNKSFRSFSVKARLFQAFFSPNGDLLATVEEGNWDLDRKGEPDRIQLWELPSGKRLRSFALHKGPEFLGGIGGPPALKWKGVFSPDGRYLAIHEVTEYYAHPDTVRIWEIASGQLVRKLEGINDLSLPLVFSPDGRALAHAQSWRTSLDNKRKTTYLVRDLLTFKEPRLVGDGPDFVCLGTAALVPSLEDPRGPVTCLVFSPDGKRLATASADQTVLLWDAKSFLPSQPPEKQSPAKELENLWQELAHKHGATAYQAMVSLSEAPEQTVAFLKSRLPTERPVPAEQIAALIKDLNSDRFLVRDNASKKLESLGDHAEAALRKALEGKDSSLEFRRRLEKLVRILEVRAVIVPLDRLQRIRGITVLEWLGTQDAIKVLEHLAGLETEAWFHREVRASLLRLRARAPLSIAP